MDIIIKYQQGGGTSNGMEQGSVGGELSAQGGFMQSAGYGMIALGVGGIANKFPTPNADLNSNNLMAALARGAISSALMSSGNPYAMAAGAAVMVLDKTGGFTDMSQGLGTGNDVGNAVMSFLLPGAGYFFMPKKTDNYKMSAGMLAMQSGYAGAVQNAGTAEGNSGAKLWFGRGKANSMIANAKAKDLTIQGIKEQSDLDYQAMASMTLNKAMSNAYNLRGGYHLAYARAGKFGMRIDKVKQLSLQVKFKNPDEIKDIYVMKNGGQFFKDIFTPTSEEENKTFFDALFMQEGGKVEKKKDDKTYQEFLSTLPKNLQEGNDGEDGYRMRYLFDNSPDVWNFEDALKAGLFELNSEDNTYHGFSIFPSTGEFLKSKNHPTIQYELDWYNGDSDDAKKFREEYDLITEEDGKPLTYYRYKRKVKSNKEGGQMNVIPEGSLHVRLHHMENASEFTKKGIPVVDNEGNQLAEIELNEIIFNKEVTQLLEELCKKFNSDEYTAKEKENFAIEAGKLLSVLIMENTDDRTGLINTITNELNLANN